MSHTTIVQTDFEPQITISEQPGRWFKVWESTVFSGLLAQLTGGEVRMFWVLCAHRERDGVLSICSEAALCRYTGRSLYQIRDTRRALCLRDNGRICRHHGGDVYELMPYEPLLGRRATAPATAGENPTPEWGKPHGEDGKPHGAEGALRAHQNQPTRREDREIGQKDTARAIAEREVSRLGLVGWPELSLYGLRAAERGDLAGVLRDLGAGNGLVEQVEGLDGLTVDEIMRTAAGVANDPKAINRPYCVCARLAMSRGKRLERPEIGRASRMGPEWADLARLRLAKSGGRR